MKLKIVVFVLVAIAFVFEVFHKSKEAKHPAETVQTEVSQAR